MACVLCTSCVCSDDETWGEIAHGEDSQTLKPNPCIGQVRFFEVSEEELVKQRQSFKDGQLAIKIEEETFDMAKHNAFVESIAAETAAFQATQREAAAKQVRTHI